jgi:hypothetical protein
MIEQSHKDTHKTKSEFLGKIIFEQTPVRLIHKKRDRTFMNTVQNKRRQGPQTNLGYFAVCECWEGLIPVCQKLRRAPWILLRWPQLTESAHRTELGTVQPLHREEQFSLC